MRQSENTSYLSIFSDRDIIIDEKIIDGTHVFAIFGDISYDAKIASCEEDTILEVTSIFSDVNLHIPDNVKVILKGNPIFGDMKDKRKITSSLINSPTILVRVLSLFGDVNIR